MIALLATTLALAPIEQFELKNHLGVVLMEDHRLPRVDIAVAYRAAPAEEPPRKEGLARVAAAVALERTMHFASAPKNIEALGGWTGQGIDLDAVLFRDEVPSDALEAALRIESDRMTAPAPIDHEALVIAKDEVRRRHPGYRESWLVRANVVFPAPHPYRMGVYGDALAIDGLAEEDVLAFERSYYVPANAVLALVGDFDPAAARALIERLFERIPPGERALPRDAPVVEPKASVRRKVTESEGSERIVVTWAGTWAHDPEGNAACEVLAELLAGGRGSRLSRSLVLGDGLARRAEAGVSDYELADLVSVFVTLLPSPGFDDALAKVASTLDDIRQNGPTRAEVDAAIVRRVFIWLKYFESPGDRSALVAKARLAGGDADLLSTRLSRLRAVTPEAVRDFARRWLRPDRKIEVLTEVKK